MTDKCNEHSGTCARVDELQRFQDRQEGTDGVNQRLFEKVDKVSGKLNLILGAVFVLWPAIQVIMWLVGQRK